MQIPDELNHGIEGYEYGIQHHYGPTGEWKMTSTNHFDGWYPSEKSMKNALAQLRATRYGWKSGLIYRPVRRPVGVIEVLPG
jgi:hypothetical protein